MNPILKSWLRNADSWSQTIAQELILSRKLATNAAILSAVPSAPSRILDLGCGEGWLCRQLRTHGHEMVGIDGVPKLVQRAREIGGDIQYHCYSYDELRQAIPLGLGVFNGILLNFALFEAGETLNLLEALSPLLTNTGFLIIQTVALEPGTPSGFRTEDWQGFPIAFSEPMPWYYRDRSQWAADLAQLKHWRLQEIKDIHHPETEQVLSWVIRLQVDKK